MDTIPSHQGWYTGGMTFLGAFEFVTDGLYRNTIGLGQGIEYIVEAEALCAN